MAILRNIDVARRFDVSPATVKNWIQYALQDKFQLDLTRIGDRYYIEDSPANISRLSKIKAQGVKYRSKNETIDVSPSPRFYDIFSEQQIADLMSHIQYHHLIPYKYFCFDEGSKWIYESLYDVKELNPKYQTAMNTISFKFATFLRTLIAQHPHAKIQLFELTASIHCNFFDDAITLLKEKSLPFTYYSCSTSSQIHELRKIYLEEFHQIEPVCLDFDADTVTQEALQNYISDDCINIYFLPGGWLNMVHNRKHTLHTLQYICRPSQDYVVFDVDLVTEKTSTQSLQIASDLITVQKLYVWLFSYLNILSYCDNSVSNSSKNNAIFYRNLTTKTSIMMNYTLHGETKSFLLPKDTELFYYQLYKFELQEFIDYCHYAKLQVVSYFFTEYDTSGLFFTTSRRSMIGD